MKLRTFTVELYIRALTTDMNNLESQKSDDDSEKVEETTKRLANGFSNLADILKDNVQVSRECALTAFSLQPTLDRLRKIEELARLSGFNVLDTGQIWECKLHPPITSSDDICWICNTCGKWMCKRNLDLRLTTNFALNEALNFEQLGISSQLCDDLAVVLNGPRYHLLSWLLRWEDLHRLCEMYLNDMERTKNLVTELKFVDIDYSMFVSVKREPVDELAGIERGYERFLYADVNMIENCNPEPPEIIPQAKSDPNTLKTLRMFRHNIKRNKPQVTQNVLESNNLANSSQDTTWLQHRYDQNFSYDQQNPYQNMGNYRQNPLQRSFSDAIFNLTNSQLKRQSQEGALDFSSTGCSDQSRNVLDFRSIKRKSSEKLEPIFGYEKNYQKFSSNYPKSSSNDNFLHDMITYEFSRVSDVKRKRSDVLQENGTGSIHTVQKAKVPIHNDWPWLKRQLKIENSSDKILPHTTGLKSDTNSTPKNVLRKNYSATDCIISNIDLKSNEEAVLAPSKGFPSFDKIPPPPQKEKTEDNKFQYCEILPKNEQTLSNNKLNQLKSNKRVKVEEINYLPEKKPKIEELNFPQNSQSPLLERELTKKKVSREIIKDKLIKALLSKNDGFPKNYSGLLTKDVQTTSTNNISTPNTSTSNQVEKRRNSACNADVKFPKETNEHKMLLKTLSGQHPIIITKSDEFHETKSDITKETVVKSENCQETKKEVKVDDCRKTKKDLRNLVCRDSRKRVRNIACQEDKREVKIADCQKTEKTVNGQETKKHLRFFADRDTRKRARKVPCQEDKREGKIADCHEGKNGGQKTEKLVKTVDGQETKKELRYTCRDTRKEVRNVDCQDGKGEVKISGSQQDKKGIKTVFGEKIEKDIKSVNGQETKDLRIPTHRDTTKEVKTVDGQKFEKGGKTVNDPRTRELRILIYRDTTKEVKKVECQESKEEVKIANGHEGKKGIKVVEGQKSEKDIKTVDCQETKKELRILVCRDLIKEVGNVNCQEAEKGDYKDCQSETKKFKDLFFKDEKTSSWKSSKELKIVLHRLSDEVINSFIPSTSAPSQQNCNYSFNKQKRPVRRPRKLVSCKYQMATMSRFDRRAFEKYSLRTLNKHDRLNRIRARNARRNCDMHKKTGHKLLKKYHRQRKIAADKMRKAKKDEDKDSKKYVIDEMNPCVVLERLPLDTNYVRSILSNVPGLNDYEMIRPTNVDHIVNVVQISGGRSASTVPVQNTQTSTQITPHIQRIGQPRNDKPEHNSNSDVTTTTVTPASTSSTKPTTSQPSTLINILSQQIIRPGQSNCIRNRSSPLINILSQQIIRPATTQVKTAGQSEGQVIHFFVLFLFCLIYYCSVNCVLVSFSYCINKQFLKIVIT